MDESRPAPGPRARHGEAAPPERVFLGQPLTNWGRAALVPVWIGSIFVAINAIVTNIALGQIGMDARAYWWAARSATPYAEVPEQAAYLYSPAFAQALHVPAMLPWPAVLTLWMLAETAVLIWLLRPLGWRWAPPALMWCVPEILIGNVFGFLALAVVIGVGTRGARPAAWALPVLTKITPGLGLLWHPLRGQWRAFAVGLAAIVGLTALSYALDPGLWHQWIDFLRAGAPGNRGYGGDSTRWIRYAAAPVLLYVAARRGWAWLLPVVTLLALPVIDGNAVLALLAAIPRLVPHSAASVGTLTPVIDPAHSGSQSDHPRTTS